MCRCRIKMNQSCLDRGFGFAVGKGSEFDRAGRHAEARAAYLTASVLAGIMKACAPPEDEDKYGRIIRLMNEKAIRSGDAAAPEAPETRVRAVGCDEVVAENDGLRRQLSDLAMATGNADISGALEKGVNVSGATADLTAKAVGWYQKVETGDGGTGPAGGKCPSEKELKTRTDVSGARTFDQIIGLDVAKRRLVREVVNPLRWKGVAEQQKVTPVNVLLYGPGGTGKTQIIKAVAKATDTPFFSADAASLKGAYVGQTEKCLKVLIDAAKADGGIIFIDEIDSILAGTSDVERNAQTAFKQLVQAGEADQPVVTGATNSPWDIKDEAVQRRFPLKIYISLPNPGERHWYLAQIKGKSLCDTCTLKPLDLEDILNADQWTDVLQRTRGFTPFDLDNLFQAARSNNDASLYNVDDLAFVRDTDPNHPPGSWRPIPLGRAAAGSEPIKTMGQLTPEERLKICWPQVTYQDFKEVLDNNWVRKSVSVEVLERFLAYAANVEDTLSIPEIQRTIDEIKTPLTADQLREADDYVNGALQSKRAELQRAEEACKRLVP